MVDVDVNIPYILKARRGQHALPRRFWGVKLTPCKSSKRLVDLVDFDDTCLLGKKTIYRMLHAFPKKTLDSNSFLQRILVYEQS